MNCKQLTLAGMATALLMIGGACQTQTTYEDPGSTETVNSDFGSTDLQLIAQQMTQSSIASPVWGTNQPRVVFGGVQNRTTQHIDTKNITDTIRTSLVQSGKFTVLASDQGIAEIAKEVEYQQSGAVDLAAAVELGKQLGAEFVFYGRFTEIQKRDDDLKSRFMKFTFNAVNVQTRQIVWADEKQIMKVEDKSFLGW